MIPIQKLNQVKQCNRRQEYKKVLFGIKIQIEQQEYFAYIIQTVDSFMLKIEGELSFDLLLCNKDDHLKMPICLLEFDKQILIVDQQGSMRFITVCQNQIIEQNQQLGFQIQYINNYKDSLYIFTKQEIIQIRDKQRKTVNMELNITVYSFQYNEELYFIEYISNKFYLKKIALNQFKVKSKVQGFGTIFKSQQLLQIKPDTITEVQLSYQTIPSNIGNKKIQPFIIISQPSIILDEQNIIFISQQLWQEINLDKNTYLSVDVSVNQPIILDSNMFCDVGEQTINIYKITNEHSRYLQSIQLQDLLAPLFSTYLLSFDGIYELAKNLNIDKDINDVIVKHVQNNLSIDYVYQSYKEVTFSNIDKVELLFSSLQCNLKQFTSVQLLQVLDQYCQQYLNQNAFNYFEYIVQNLSSMIQISDYQLVFNIVQKFFVEESINHEFKLYQSLRCLIDLLLSGLEQFYFQQKDLGQSVIYYLIQISSSQLQIKLENSLKQSKASQTVEILMLTNSIFSDENLFTHSINEVFQFIKNHSLDLVNLHNYLTPCTILMYDEVFKNIHCFPSQTTCLVNVVEQDVKQVSIELIQNYEELLVQLPKFNENQLSEVLKNIIENQLLCATEYQILFLDICCKHSLDAQYQQEIEDILLNCEDKTHLIDILIEQQKETLLIQYLIKHQKYLSALLLSLQTIQDLVLLSKQLEDIFTILGLNELSYELLFPKFSSQWILQFSEQLFNKYESDISIFTSCFLEQQNFVYYLVKYLVLNSTNDKQISFIKKLNLNNDILHKFWSE